MLGQMMQFPLLTSMLLNFAERHHSKRAIVSRRTEGDIHRYTYRDFALRSKKLASALSQRGITEGTRIATLAWNGYRHLEIYYGVSGIGAVVHTINPRLHPDQIVWIADDAEDSMLFFDSTFLPIIEKIAPKFAHTHTFVLMTDQDKMPTQSAIPNLICYEDLINSAPREPFNWPIFDENTAAMLCYTSGTTGNPKGVLYSHRSTLLHAMVGISPDALNIGQADVVLPVVPMFHVNAWGIPFMGCMTGAKLVFPGPALDGQSLYEIFEAEKVTVSAGVPTVWQALLGYVDAHNKKFSTMRRTVIGGAACAKAMMQAFQEKYQVNVIHAWGMTEMSPLGTVCTLHPEHKNLPAEERYAQQTKQGRAIFGVDMKIVDPNGDEVAWDGKTSGDLWVRGPWILSSYFNNAGGQILHDGWFATGDVAHIDGDGFMQITDRSKDVIKSGGEWIGSIELENLAMAHPSVAMAACIAARHPKWDERPLLVVMKKPNADLSRHDMLTFFEGKVAKWWIPDDVVFVDAIPLGATGKIQKMKLREMFKDYTLPTI